MSFQYMTGQEMLAVTRPWVDGNHPAHVVLLNRPLTAAMMPDMASAHAGLESELHPYLAQMLSKLIQRTVVVDTRHDDVVRAIDARLTAELAIATDPTTVERLTRLRALLMPEGLSIVKKSYAHEVGQAETVAAQVTSDDRSLLQDIPMMSGTLEDVVDDYFATARELGDLEQRRRELGDTRPGRGALLRARHRWVRVVNLILQAAEILGPEDTEMHTLVNAVDHAKHKAFVRRRQRLAEGEDAVTEPDDGAISDDDVDLGAGADAPVPEQNDGDGAPVDPGQDEPAPALTTAETHLLR